jgi:hypothetical protein
MTAAAKVLIAGGVLNLAYGVLLGYPITVIRHLPRRRPQRAVTWRGAGYQTSWPNESSR